MNSATTRPDENRAPGRSRGPVPASSSNRIRWADRLRKWPPCNFALRYQAPCRSMMLPQVFNLEVAMVKEVPVQTEVATFAWEVPQRIIYLTASIVQFEPHIVLASWLS